MTNLTTIFADNATLIANVIARSTEVKGTELVTLNNILAEELGKKPIAKFASKPKGFDKVNALLEEAAALLPKEEPKPVEGEGNADIPAAEPKKESGGDKPKSAKEPKVKPHRASDSYRNLKALQKYLKEELIIEGVAFGMSVIGTNEVFLRDQLSIKVKGKRDPIARIKIALGEAEVRTVYTSETELVLSNENETVLVELTDLISNYQAAELAAAEAVAKAKEEAKTDK